LARLLGDLPDHRHPLGEREQARTASGAAVRPVTGPVAGRGGLPARGVCFQKRRELFGLLPIVHRACHLLHCSRSDSGPDTPAPALDPERG